MESKRKKNTGKHDRSFAGEALGKLRMTYPPACYQTGDHGTNERLA